MSVTDKCVMWTRRVVAIGAGVFSFGLFIPLGLVFWFILIVRAVLSFGITTLILAMRSTRGLHPDSMTNLHQVLGFFPRGVGIIFDTCATIWRGEVTGEVPALPERELLTNIVLAALVLGVVYWVVWGGKVGGTIAEVRAFVSGMFPIVLIVSIVSALTFVIFRVVTRFNDAEHAKWLEKIKNRTEESIDNG